MPKKAKKSPAKPPKAAKKQAKSTPKKGVKTRVSQSALAQKALGGVRGLRKELALSGQMKAKERKEILPTFAVGDSEIEAASAAFDSFGARIGAKINTDGARVMIARGKSFQPVLQALELLPHEARDTLARERAPFVKQVQLAYKTMEGLMQNPDNADMADAWDAMVKARAPRLAAGVKTRETNKAAKDAAAAAASSTTTTTKTETTTTNGGKSQ